MSLYNFPDRYEGSSLAFIKNYIIPFLPKIDNVIRLTDSLIEYLEDDKKTRYIRKLKGYNQRSSLYNFGNKKFTVTDNEPALWIYMECYEKEILSFNEYEFRKSFPIAFALKKEESLSKNFSNAFKIGKMSRENDFSKNGLKHCHIFDCSPKNIDLHQLTLDQRMLRLLSPMNHFPFPSPRKFEMQQDFGENLEFRKILINTLLNEYYKSEYQISYFMRFLTKCGSELDKNTSADFQIKYQIKSPQNLLINPKKYNIPIQKEIKSKQPTNIKSDVLEIKKTRFYVNEVVLNDLLNNEFKFFKLNVLPKKGNHPKGYYMIPRNVIIDFILNKKHRSFNWEKNGNFNQDSIPSSLKGFFTFQ